MGESSLHVNTRCSLRVTAATGGFEAATCTTAAGLTDAAAAADRGRAAADVDAAGAGIGAGLRGEEEDDQEGDAEEDGLETHFVAGCVYVDG